LGGITNDSQPGMSKQLMLSKPKPCSPFAYMHHPLCSPFAILLVAFYPFFYYTIAANFY